MIIENKFGTVDLDYRPSQNKKVLISFSGGADSTLMFYLTLKATPADSDVQFFPLTGVTPQKGKFKQFTSEQNYQNLIQDFPQHADKIHPRIIIYNETQEELGDYSVKLCREGTTDIVMFGLTKNPPRDVMEKHDLLRNRETLRDIDGDKWLDFRYHPFRNVDKRWIAQCYYDFDLMDRYYNNTISCERLRETPDMLHSEEPCGHCWWCREKKMAFGILDGQR